MDALKIIDGKYRIRRLLGRGGFSEVYLVDGPDGACALKLLQGDLASLKKSAIEEFKNEFSILKDMRHPHIASILDFGFDDSCGRYYYTSELIEGEDIINASRGLSIDQITALFVQALRALGYLHSYRTYHFDIKSANLLVSGGPEPALKIIDFGLAGIDPGGRLIGTPSYMAPEIVSREHADGRADLYSLGVLWYSCVARKNPFRASDSSETLSMQLKLIPPPPSSAVPALPKWIDHVIMRLLEKNPANRFPTAAAVIREINRQSGSDYPVETRQTLLSYLPDEGRFVGRARELADLESSLYALKEAGGISGGCLVEGGIGVGKTRLMRELKYRAQLKGIRIEWASAGASDEFNSWCAALSEHLSKGSGMCAFFLDDAQAAMDDDAMRGSLLGLISRARRPATGSGVWIAVSARGFEPDDDGGGLSSMLPLSVRVLPFTREELGAYVVSLTGLESPPRQLLDGLFDRTEGNPLFLTELLRSLIECGALFDEHGRWNEAIFEDVGVDFSKAVVPRTLGELLLERARAVSDEGQRLMEALAVAARPASAAELGLWAGVPNPGAEAMRLVAAAILDRAGNFAVRFHNALMEQAMLEAMPHRRRGEMHDKIADSLRRAGADEAEILEHASLGTDRAAAFDAAMELGERALRAGLGGQAVRYIGRALDLVDSGDLERSVEVQMKLGEAHLIGHDYQAAMEHLSAVEATISASAGSRGMARWRAEALVRLGGTYVKLQGFDRARAALHDASNAVVAAGGDAALDLVIRNFLGSMVFMEGDLEGARAVFEKTAAAVRSLSEEMGARVTNNDLGAVLTALGESGQAKRVLERQMAQAERLGDDLLIGRAHYNMAQLLTSVHDHSGAIESYEKCIEVCRRSQNIELLLRAYNGLGNGYRAGGDPERSIAFYERGMALHEMTGDLRGGAAIAINIGLIESERTRFEAALDRIIPAVEYLRALPGKTASDWAALSRGLLEQGDIAGKAGRLGEAKRCLEEAGGITQAVRQASPQRFWVLAAQAEVAHAQGRTGELSDLMGMLDSAASNETERRALSDLKSRLGAGERAPERRRDQPGLSERMIEIEKIVSAAERAPGSKIKEVFIKALLDAVEEIARADVSKLVSGGMPLKGLADRAEKAGRHSDPGPAAATVDGASAYDESRSWADYERVIIAKCLAANAFKVRAASRELGVTPATLYRKMRSFGLYDRSSQAYSDAFVYSRGRRLKDYVPIMFAAALEGARGRARQAIANLRVSQGYFYKVMKAQKNRGRACAP